MARRMEDTGERGDRSVDERAEAREDQPERAEARPETRPHDRTTHAETQERVHPARGGFSLGAVFTGVVVAFGSMFLLAMLIGGVALAAGLDRQIATDVTQIGIGVGIALVVAQFVAYLWGGYTAGRMARGGGMLNGLLVSVLALLIVAGVTGLFAAFAPDGQVIAFGATQLPVAQEGVMQFGIGLGIGSLIAMFAGSILGGALGARWHDKLEAQGELRLP